MKLTLTLLTALLLTPMTGLRAVDTKAAQRSVVTDELVRHVGKPDDAADYVAKRPVGTGPTRCPWQYLRGWARHLAVPDQPDLVITYTNGNATDLEKLIIEIKSNTTADIIVPRLHWRKRDQPLWGKSENAMDQDVAAVREVCQRSEK